MAATSMFWWSGTVEDDTDETVISVPTGQVAIIYGIYLYTGSNTTVSIQFDSTVIVNQGYGTSPIQLGMPILGGSGEDVKVVGGGTGSEGRVVISGEFASISELAQV